MTGRTRALNDLSGDGVATPARAVIGGPAPSDALLPTSGGR